VALEEGEEEVLTVEEEKSPLVGRGDGEQHQVSDEAHASFFFLKRKRKIFFWDYPMFLLSKIWSRN